MLEPKYILQLWKERLMTPNWMLDCSCYQPEYHRVKEYKTQSTGFSKCIEDIK